MLFNKKITSVHFNHLIASGCTVTGKIAFRGCVLIDSLGSIIGSMIGEDLTEEKNMSKIVMNENSTVNGDKISAFDMHLDGILNVDSIWCENDLVIGKNAKIENSTIYHRNISIEMGATLINCRLNHLDYCSQGEIV